MEYQQASSHEANFNLPALTHEATFFHENMNVYKALEQMKAQKMVVWGVAY